MRDENEGESAGGVEGKTPVIMTMSVVQMVEMVAEGKTSYYYRVVELESKSDH